MAQRPQRPGPPARTASASSFAEGFSAARHKVDKEYKKDLQKELKDLALEEGTSSESENATPGLSSSGGSTPASAATPLTGPITPSLDPNVADDFAFAFDIDGVLIRGGRVIPEAIEAMKVLNGENEYGVRVWVSSCVICLSSLANKCWTALTFS